MKWFPLSKLQKKIAQKDSEGSQNAMNQVVRSIQVRLDVHNISLVGSDQTTTWSVKMFGKL